MSRKIPIPDEKSLRNYYSEYGVSISDIARKYSTSNATVRKWLKHYGIELKSHAQACVEKNSLRNGNIPSKECLSRDYENFTSLKDLQQKYSIGQKTLYEWFDHHDIGVKPLSERISNQKQKLYEDIQYSKSEVIQALDNNHHKKSLAASALNISLSHLKVLIQRYSITTHDTTYKSAAELDLYEYCQTIAPNYTWLSGSRNIIPPYELDIFCPELNLAIEYCGLYWHSENFGNKQRDYHRTKWTACKSTGINLLTVFEYDDLTKVKSLIQKKCGIINRIYARNTEVKYISKVEAALFHDKYHLNGKVGSSVNMGLFHDQNLVMVLSMGKSRFSNKYDWECTRLTNANNTAIIGGASKLFHHFKKHHEGSIVTFADLRFGEGLTYEKCGFKLLEYTQPNYWYFHRNSPNAIYSRVAFQKHKLKTKLKYYDETLTEFQNMVNNGYDRIWDVGNAKYVHE